MQKIQLNLLKDGESRLNCRHFPLDGAFESSRKQNKGLEGQSEKDTLDALKSANELMADNGENQNADAADSDRTKSFVELEKETRVQKNRWMNTLGL
jgi:hypothetical protein